MNNGLDHKYPTRPKSLEELVIALATNNAKFQQDIQASIWNLETQVG